MMTYAVTNPPILSRGLLAIHSLQLSQKHKNESIERWYRRYLGISAQLAAFTLLGVAAGVDIVKPIPRYNGHSPIESRMLVP
jgi:hypothetical protein